MAGSKLDPEIVAHLEWLGFVRPTGLVVSAPALVRAGAILDRRDAEGQRLLCACVEERTFDPKEGSVPCVPDFHRFAETVLEWSFSPKGYAGTPECPIPIELKVPLPEYGETLRPDFAVRELEPKDSASSWQLIVRVLSPGEDFDEVSRAHGQLEASPHGRMERLLRQTGVPAGILFNNRTLRIVSAPRGESSGWLDFRVGDMVLTAGRPISTAMRLLLGQTRLLALPRTQRLAALLEASRKFQNEVSERLAEQVLHALYELLRGFQSAHDASKGQLLREPLTQHPDEVYRALLTVILRLVFLLYAEERDMLPEDETFLRYYSLAGLYEHLREDAALFPDTMDQRYGAWAQLLVLFRMIHDGAESDTMRLPKRHGVLFDPERFTFLEGRSSGDMRSEHSRVEPPLVPDGTIYRALEKLLVLDGERISYRALDVEQIGSVYETMMGFRLETATGRSIAVKAQKKQGAPTALDLEALLAEPAAKREKWIQDRADRKLSDSVKKTMIEAKSVEDLHAALLPVSDLAATPDLVPKGAMVLQPSEERRRSGSHYTPRALTEPIVRTTLHPILTRLRSSDGRPPLPAQILDLKVCDPAMGSGAFLVEACRQLGDALVEAWRAHGDAPAIPPDEDEVIFARRLIAHRCLYGVDRNPMAVDLAKVSLWLVTLAKDHALTFLDHALRHGDSLVGLSRKQIEAFHWDPEAPRFQAGFETMRVREHVAKVAELRRRIREADEIVSDNELYDLWNQAQDEVGKVRLFGDLVLAAFFSGEQSSARERKRSDYANAVVNGEADHYRSWLEEWRHAERSLAPFHWEIELPEVFDRENPGFDSIVGNPPFAGVVTLATSSGETYTEYLRMANVMSGGKCDLVAFFFRKAWLLIRASGSFGFVATKTIAEGDTRRSGLARILEEGGVIYDAWRRFRWPGRANVYVSRLCIARGTSPTKRLDGKPATNINAFLLDSSNNSEPSTLNANSSKAFLGCKPGAKWHIVGEQAKGHFPHQYVDVVRAEDPRLVRLYVGGADLYADAGCRPSRYAIALGLYEPEQAAAYPKTLTILKQASGKSLGSTSEWWRYSRRAVDLYSRLPRFKKVLVRAEVSDTFAFVSLPHDLIFSNKSVVFLLEGWSSYSVVQSRVHEHWSELTSSTQGQTLSYVPAYTFDTFPFPEDWHIASLEEAGNTYYEFRGALMFRNNEGLTKTYNRFHDPDECDPEIVKLRELHAAMDRVVLDAYGWSDIPTDCEFLLDYEINEEEWGDKKKPYRFRWPDQVRDHVLARLLELNARRAKEEARTGAAVARKEGKKTVAKRAAKASNTEDLFS